MHNGFFEAVKLFKKFQQKPELLKMFIFTKNIEALTVLPK